MSPRARMLSRATRESPCAELDSTRRPFFSRISPALSPFPSEPCAHTPLLARGSARDFLLFAARRAERRETMVVFVAKLKPPTDFSYFADERRRQQRRSLRSWLSCAKSPLGVFRFISASRVCINPRDVYERRIGCPPCFSLRSLASLVSFQQYLKALNFIRFEDLKTFYEILKARVHCKS